jgi:PAS domain S-box-containing protein
MTALAGVVLTRAERRARVQAGGNARPARERLDRLAAEQERDASLARAVEAERETRAILESITDGFAALDGDSRFVYVNAEAERLSGRARGELIGRTYLEVFPELAGTEVERLCRRTIEERTPAEFEDYEQRSGRWFEVRVYPGARGGIAVCVRDVTSRKIVEEQLRQTQKLESLGVLAGGVAHDFNNLLTGILGNASLVLEDLPPEEPDRGLLEAIVSSSESAAQLTRQLLAYAGQGTVSVEPLDLSEVVRETLSFIQSSIPPCVRIELELQSGLPAIKADRGQTNQLVMNLVLNAAESIEPGRGGTVLVRTARQEIPGSTPWRALAGRQPAPGTYVCLEVRDNGCGIDPRTRARIFDPFFTTKFLGRGLGLAAVDGILRSQNGCIDVETELGRGATFRVLLPVAPQSGPPAVIGQRAERGHSDRGNEADTSIGFAQVPGG